MQEYYNLTHIKKCNKNNPACFHPWINFELDNTMGLMSVSLKLKRYETLKKIEKKSISMKQQCSF